MLMLSLIWAILFNKFIILFNTAKFTKLVLFKFQGSEGRTILLPEEELLLKAEMDHLRAATSSVDDVTNLILIPPPPPPTEFSQF
jgi:hypothetical protein